MISENIVRMVIESKDSRVNYSKKGKEDLITKKMVQAMLDGTEESVSAKNPDRDQEMRMYLNGLVVPGDS